MGWSGSSQQGTSGGPFVTTTTVTTVLDLSTGMTKTFHSSSNRGASDKFNYGGENRMMEGAGFYNVLSENDINMLNNSWNILRKRSDFAPKVFMRYKHLLFTISQSQCLQPLILDTSKPNPKLKSFSLNLLTFL